MEAAEGTALAAAFDDLLGERQRCGLMVALPDYPDLFLTAFGDRAVRRLEKPDATLHIYGPLESRLMQVDRVINSASTCRSDASACRPTTSRNCSAPRT